MSQQPNFQPAITFLNMSGDITITWDSTNQEEILRLVEDKMKEGFSFFILKPRMLRILGNKQVQATSIEDVAKAGSVVVRDATFARMMGKLKLHDTAVEALVSAGTASLGAIPDNVTYMTSYRAKTANEVMANQTVAVRRIVGG